MPLFSVLDTDPSVKELAAKVASLLGTPSHLESIRRVPTAEEGMHLFQFQWVEDFQKLADQLAITMAHDTHRTIEEIAGINIKSFTSGEVKKGVVFLIESVLKVPNNGLVILLPLPPLGDAFRDALRQLPISRKFKEPPQSLDHGEAILHLQSLDGKSSCETKLQPESTTIIYGHVRFETIPMIPFLMLSFPTIAAPVEGRNVVEGGY